jgi:hypothetical protein
MLELQMSAQCILDGTQGQCNNKRKNAQEEEKDSAKGTINPLHP